MFEQWNELTKKVIWNKKYNIEKLCKGDATIKVLNSHLCTVEKSY